MADLNFILQAVTKFNHAASIRSLLTLPKATQVVISVAFARTAGLQAIEAEVKPLATRTKVFVGIRNDITSIQVIKQLLALKVELYAVDTGCRRRIFHPKLYWATNGAKAVAIVGSANMTFGGLHNNIEASTVVDLDLAKPSDKAYADALTKAFDQMVIDHPNHAFKITDEKHADQLFEEGRLADEDVIIAPASGSSVRKGDRDSLSPMKLVYVKPAAKVVPAKAPAKAPAKVTPVKLMPAPAKPMSEAKYLVWESKPLSRRDLTIPTAPGTNPTGSMGFKKGLYDHIDQRHYFYDEVFAGLNWAPVKQGSLRLQAKAKFELVVKNIGYGTFDLVLSHNTDTECETYLQGNMMTSLHWGVAKPIIARDDLLGRNLYLYRKDSKPPEFMIEID
jgi:HKD family nuclease